MSNEEAPPKVSVTLEIKTLVDITDTGYLGESATVAKHMQHALEEVARWSWLVEKRSGTSSDPERVRVRTKVLGVTIIPREAE